MDNFFDLAQDRLEDHYLKQAEVCIFIFSFCYVIKIFHLLRVLCNKYSTSRSFQSPVLILLY